MQKAVCEVAPPRLNYAVPSIDKSWDNFWLNPLFSNETKCHFANNVNLLMVSHVSNWRYFSRRDSLMLELTKKRTNWTIVMIGMKIGLNAH